MTASFWTGTATVAGVALAVEGVAAAAAGADAGAVAEAEVPAASVCDAGAAEAAFDPAGFVGADAASEVFGGPSSACTDLHAMTAIRMTATRMPLLHAKLVKLNRSLIQSMPPRELLKSSYPHPALEMRNRHHCESKLEDFWDFN